MNSRGRRTVERALSRRIRRERERITEKLNRDFLHQRKIKNEEEKLMGFWDSVRNVVTSEKASKATTPPMAKQKPVYGDKKMVKAKNPKKGKK